MQCPDCQFENPEEVKFCVECGSKLEAKCPNCGHINSPNFKFCGECGAILNPAQGISNVISETESLPFSPTIDKRSNDIGHSTGVDSITSDFWKELNEIDSRFLKEGIRHMAVKQFLPIIDLESKLSDIGKAVIRAVRRIRELSDRFGDVRT